MKKSILKWLVLCLIAGAGVLMSALMPAAVENSLPEVATTTVTVYEYRESVRGRGVMYSAQDGIFLLSAAVAEADIIAVEIGQPAELYGSAIGEAVYTATVLETADFAYGQEINGVMQTVVDVILQVDNPDRLLRSGYTAEAVIHTSEPREILLIPYEAINQNDEGEYVLVLQGNTAVHRDIITGLELSEGAELLTGVNTDEKLVVNPEKYTANMLVRAV